MSEVKKVPNLTQKGHSYYFRIRVPKHLLDAYGRLEVTQALGAGQPATGSHQGAGTSSRLHSPISDSIA